MIDFVKIAVIGIEPQRWTQNPELSFERIINIQTGEIIKETATWNSLKFTIKSNYMNLQGSLHKCFNHLVGITAPNANISGSDKGFNGNKFNYMNLLYLLSILQDKFSINPYDSYLMNLEVGVNIQHKFKTEKVLNGLIMCRGNKFNRPESYSLRSAQFSQFRIKVYNKALQYGLPNEVMRFELAFKKMETINQMGIFTLADLLNISKLSKLGNLVCLRWSQILIIDPTIRSQELTPIERIRLKEYRNQDWWTDQASNRLDRHKKRYHKIEAHHSEHLKSKISQLISQEFDNLIMCVRYDSSDIVSSITQADNLYQFKENRIINTHY